MNNLLIMILKALRKSYAKLFTIPPLPQPPCEQDPDMASKIIYDQLMDDKPCMIARLGSNELLCMVTYSGIFNSNRNIISYIQGHTTEWWWNEQNLDNMYCVAGFYPRTYDAFSEFARLMIRDVIEVDVLGSWLPNEFFFQNELKNAFRVHFELLNPYFSNNPWTKALEGKKILVVHPFKEQIISQYKKRTLLFDRHDVLPNFGSLEVIKAVQSNGENSTDFKDWFAALDYMKTEIDNADYDICLIGCGAYGFPLAAHVKRQGKKAVHLGGSLQLLFGIKGKRWENPDYNPIYNYSALMNEHWVYPDESTKPKNADKVEGACYW